MKQVYIVLLNWNGWQDTIECLESIFRNDYPDYRVVVCDNDSQNHSLAYIKAWAENRLDVFIPSGARLRGVAWPPVEKPIQYVEYVQAEAENGGNDKFDDARLVLIKNHSNLGFAGGNNAGMRYALARGDFDYIWLLNNDTVIKSDALSQLVVRMKEKPNAGMCGSTLLHYQKPGRVQAMGGGYYCKWIGLPWHLGRGKNVGAPIDRERVEAWMNYIVGASLFVSRQLVQDIGLMCEEYFLYFEETDWALRAKGRYALAYAPESVVYHKVGGSIGTSSNPKHKSLICDFYSIRNRLFFTRKFFRLALPTIYITVLAALVTRMVLWRWDRVRMIVSLMANCKTKAPDIIQCLTRQRL